MEAMNKLPLAKTHPNEANGVFLFVILRSFQWCNGCTKDRSRSSRARSGRKTAPFRV
jgi:hypothetical protein